MRLLLVAGGWLLLAWPGRSEPADSKPEGIFVAVGEQGRRVSSTDGSTFANDQRWTDGTKGADEDLFDVAYGAGQFVAVGGGPVNGYLLRSRDGRDWQELPPVKDQVTTITFGHGRFVANHCGELLSSTDGERFTAGRRLDWKGDIRALRSACGDTEAGFRYVTVGDIDLRVERRRSHWRAVTEDGVTYQHADLDQPGAVDVAYGSGHFVVVGPAGLIESSHDGQAWERHGAPATENFTRVIWTGSQFLISGGMNAWVSPDGLNWKPEGYPFPAKAYLGVGGFFLGLDFKKRDEIYYSYAATGTPKWMVARVPRGPAFNAIAFGQPKP